jgi:hypothetical protein
MKLLFLHEWVGQRHEFTGTKIAPQERYISMATYLPLSDAVSRIKNYRAAYAEEYSQTGLVVVFRLLSVSDIDPLSIDELESLNVEVVENLGRT